MVFPRPIQAVVFDMDGLLIDSETVVREGVFRAVAGMGFQMSDALFARMIGLPLADSIDVLRTHFGPTFETGRFVDDERREIEALFSEGVALKAGVLELLDHLDVLGLPRAVATSSSREAVAVHLGGHRLVERFHAVVAREDVPRHKPHPDPYLAAAAALGVAPERCLALEDSHNGVRAAHAAGMMTIMVPDLLDPTEEIAAKCVHIAESLHVVHGLLLNPSPHAGEGGPRARGAWEDEGSR
jgi:HAD superfamily hydrolase (TIGR01509 family)